MDGVVFSLVVDHMVVECAYVCVCECVRECVCTHVISCDLLISHHMPDLILVLPSELLSCAPFANLSHLI